MKHKQQEKGMQQVSLAMAGGGIGDGGGGGGDGVGGGVAVAATRPMRKSSNDIRMVGLLVRLIPSNHSHASPPKS